MVIKLQNVNVCIQEDIAIFIGIRQLAQMSIKSVKELTIMGSSGVAHHWIRRVVDITDNYLCCDLDKIIQALSFHEPFVYVS